MENVIYGWIIGKNNGNYQGSHLKATGCDINPLTIKKEKNNKIARSYNTERAYRMCISDIAKWTSLTCKVPTRMITNKIWILIVRVEEKLNIEKSPEEDMCIITIKKCLCNIDQYICSGIYIKPKMVLQN